MIEAALKRLQAYKKFEQTAAPKGNLLQKYDELKSKLPAIRSKIEKKLRGAQSSVRSARDNIDRLARSGVRKVDRLDRDMLKDAEAEVRMYTEWLHSLKRGQLTEEIADDFLGMDDGEIPRRFYR